MNDLQNLGVTFLCSGGVGFAIVKGYLKTAAKEALGEDLKELKNEVVVLHERINKNERYYVDQKFCNMQHTNQAETLQNINSKLDKLTEIMINNATKR